MASSNSTQNGSNGFDLSMCFKKDKIEIKVSKDKLKHTESPSSAKPQQVRVPQGEGQSAKGKKSRVGCMVDTGKVR